MGMPQAGANRGRLYVRCTGSEVPIVTDGRIGDA